MALRFAVPNAASNFSSLASLIASVRSLRRNSAAPREIWIASSTYGFGKTSARFVLRCDENVRGLRFDRNDAAQPVFHRRKFARNVNVEIDRPGIGHRVALENRHVLNEKKLTTDRRLQNAQIDRIARIEFFEIEFFQPIVKPLQARKLGVDRQSRIVIDLPVVTHENPERQPQAVARSGNP